MSSRQRSRSASGVLFDDSHRSPLKRSGCSTPWTSEKKRRPNKPLPSSQLATRRPSYGSERDSRAIPSFPTSPSDFGLPSGPNAPRRRPRHDYPEISPLHHDESHSRERLRDVIRIRSMAFSELHQNVADSGENLIYRMREYERSRSAHYQSLTKTEHPQGRSRKGSFSRKKSGRRAPSSPVDDSDCGVIIGGASDGHVFRHNNQRARSLDDMEVDDSESDCSPLQRPSIFLANVPSFSPPPSGVSQEDPDDTGPRMTSPSPPTSLYCNTQLSSPSANSSVVSLAIHTPDGDDQDVSSCPSATDKAITSLNLALANGAGGLNDYSAVLEYHASTDAECYDPGDLWH